MLVGRRGGGHWPFLAGLAFSAPCGPTLGSLTPAAGEQVLGSAPRSGIWGPGKGLFLASGHFLSRADIDQLKRIMEVVGTPSPEVLAKISSEHVSHQPPALLLTQLLGAPEEGALWEETGNRAGDLGHRGLEPQAGA